MPDSSKLFFRHPNGDPITLPCWHPKVEHPNGHVVNIPCTHGFRQKHPKGDTVQTLLGPVQMPCIHLEALHPQGDPITIPCTHIVPQHEDGHPGPTVPCTHLMPVLREEFNGSLKFYTNSEVIQETTIEAVQKLSSLGVDLLSPLRPLQVFHRKPLENGGGDDPFWSHYNPFFHSIQVMRKDGLSDTRFRETLRHEIGHALIGNSLINTYGSGGHFIDKPASNYALSMTEGWAHFVALVLTHSPGIDGPVMYRNLDWETLSVSPNGKIEYCVGAFLWDLYDKMRISFERNNRGRVRLEVSDEFISLSFAQIFEVFSPSLSAVLNGPWISSVWDFAERLKISLQGSPWAEVNIDNILLSNCGPKPADADALSQIGDVFAGMSMRVSASKQAIDIRA